MTFSDTYAQEVLQSRRTRSQRAGFWAKVVSVLLAVTLVATLRSEPELRQGLTLAASDVVLKLTGRQAALSAATPAQQTGPDMAAWQDMMGETQLQMVRELGEGGALPQSGTGRLDAVKVNRPGLNQDRGHRFKRASSFVPVPQDQGSHAAQATDAQRMADQLGRMLRSMQPGL